MCAPSFSRSERGVQGYFGSSCIESGNLKYLLGSKKEMVFVVRQV